MLTCVCMLRCWMCEVEPMYVDADGVGCGWCWMRTARRVAVAWLRGFEWMRMVLEVDGEARCCRLVGWV